MKPEREGIIWALLTDEERAEMPDTASRQVWCVSEMKWKDDCASIMDRGSAYGGKAYRPRPKPAKRYRPWTPEEAVGKVVQRVKGEARMITGAAMSEGREMYEFGNFTFIWDYLVSSGYRQLGGSPCGVEITNE